MEENKVIETAMDTVEYISGSKPMKKVAIGVASALTGGLALGFLAGKIYTEKKIKKQMAAEDVEYVEAEVVDAE